MAKLSGLKHTCSMSQLAVNGMETADQIKDLIKKLTKPVYSWDMPGPPLRQRKAVICNTLSNMPVLIQAGFIEVGQYNGNDGGVVHVMLYIKPSCRIKKAKTK